VERYKIKVRGSKRKYLNFEYQEKEVSNMEDILSGVLGPEFTLRVKEVVGSAYASPVTLT